MKRSRNVLQAILAAGGLRAADPKIEAMGISALLTSGLGLVELLVGPAHSEHGTYYVTAYGCLVAIGRTKVPSVGCPDCCGEKKIDGRRCVMCRGRGEFSADHYRKISS